MHLITRSETHTPTFGRTPLDEWTARHRDLYWRYTIRTANIHAPGGIRTRNPSKRASADSRLRPHGHRNRQEYICEWKLHIRL